MSEYIEKYSAKLQEELNSACREKGLYGERLPETPDIDITWDKIAGTYIADALREVEKYPLVALGWAMYAGMGVAVLWDKDWERYGKVENIYELMRDKRGFDAMDEYIRGELMRLKGTEYDKMEQTVQSLSQRAESVLRHENADPQSETAYRLFVATTRALFRTGAGIELKRLKYDMEAMW